MTISRAKSAGGKLRWAVRRGKILRPNHCERCSKPCKPDAHHHDYAKPLDVEWLCRQCHMAEDGRIERLITSRVGLITVGLLPCITCKVPSKPLRRGRCEKCRQWWRKYGVEGSYHIAEGASKSHEGVNNPMAKLNDDSIRQIFALAAQGSTQTHIAAMMGVSRTMIDRILQRKLWKHVEL